MLEDTKMQNRKKSIAKDSVLMNRNANLSKRLANKNDSVQKVEVFLSSQETNDYNSSRIETQQYYEFVLLTKYYVYIINS